MSDKFFERMAVELSEMMKEIARERIEREAFDKEVEKISGMDCDDAAKILSRSELRDTARQAIENLKRKKRSEPREMMEAIA